MEKKIQNIVNCRYKISKTTKDVRALIIGPDESENLLFIQSIYKSYTNTLTPTDQIQIAKQSNSEYEKLAFNEKITFLNAGPSIFNKRTHRFMNENIVKYYKNKYLLTTTGDIINFNINSEDRPNILILVINGLKCLNIDSFLYLEKYVECIESFKSRGIYYPQIFVTHSEEIDEKDEVIEKTCLQLNVSRSCCHFVSTYKNNEWEPSLEKDYCLLKLMSDLIDL